MMQRLLRVPDRVRFEYEDGRVVAERTADGFAACGTRLAVLPEENGVSFVLKGTEKPLKRITLRWAEKVEPGCRILGDAWERGYGDLEWRSIVPERVLPWDFLLHREGKTAGAGVMVRPNAFCFWQVDESGITLTLDVRCGGVGVEPKGKIDLCTVKTVENEEGENAFATGRRLMGVLCPEKQRRLPKAPVYGGNNWYYAYGRSSTKDILADAGRMAECAEGLANRPFMVIDDGWEIEHGTGYNGGPWDRSNSDYPDMAALAKGIKALGVRPGLWVRPTLTRLPFPEEYLIVNRPEVMAGKGGRIIDPSVPEVLDYVTGIFRTCESWGYELIKQDFSTYDLTGYWGKEMGGKISEDGWSFHDRSKTTAMVIKDLYDAMRAGVKDETVLIGCNTVLHLAAGVFDASRTGDDTSGRQWEQTRYMGVNTLAFRMLQHNLFGASDADCVGLTTKVPWEKNKQWLDVLAKSGTPLFVSLAPDAYNEETKKAITEAFRLASAEREPAEPLDWMETTCPSLWRSDSGVTKYDWDEPFGSERNL